MSTWMTKNGYKPRSAPVVYSQEVETDQPYQAVPLQCTYRQPRAGEQVGMHLKVFRFALQILGTLQNRCRQAMCFRRRQRRKQLRRLLRSRFESYRPSQDVQLPTTPPMVLAPGLEESVSGLPMGPSTSSSPQ